MYVSIIYHFVVIVNVIIVREYRRGNMKRQARKTGKIGYIGRTKAKQQHNTICVVHHYAKNKHT
jgi:hypothetical protein